MMPWHVAETAKCPAGKPWAVIKNADGSVAGCHPTKAAALKQSAALYANEPGASMSSAVTQESRAAVDNSTWDGNAAMSACTSAADYRAICAGEHNAGTPDERQHWALPHHKSPGSPPNANGVRNSLSRLPGTQNLMNRQAAQAHLQAHMKTISPGANSAPADGEYRTVPFDIAGTEVNGDGLTFEGYAAVYNTVTRVQGWDEEFDEQIAPGAFRAITEGQYPVLMFDHGRHPLIGTMPLGRITNARDDATGLWIEARLTDNWLIQPVRDAVADKALKGMSFRFTVNDGGETWMDRASDVALRTLLNLDCPELGPVVFPQYEPTTASVRSLLDRQEPSVEAYMRFLSEELPVIGRPQAGARAASDREGGAGRRQPQSLEDRFRGDSEALALLRPLRRT